ncbi:unnamed protein product [Paramecium octaurelia]|uniref:DNA-directed RNA polymerase I subunit RPA49 n=1 Tax=Paramecium octaurelia TaxID=43137 RepID=A0A8S1V8Y9_PAROT|nr:unnamed protein product [Paramecium octaurelia]
MEVSLNFTEEPNPVVIGCPQGFPNYSNIQILTKNGEDISEPQTRKVIKLSNDQMTWIGRQNHISSNNFVGVHQGNTISLHPVLLQATLQQQIHKQNKQLQSRNSALEDGLTYFEQRKMVAEEMGTNKSRRKMRQMETNKVEEENIVQAESIKEKFNQKQQEIQEQLEVEKEIHQMEEAAIKEELLPEFVKGNVPVFQIYNVRSIVSEEDMELLDTSKLQVFVSTKREDTLHHYHPQVIQIAQGLIFDNKTKLTILKYLEYLNILFKFQFKQQFQNKNAQNIAHELGIYNHKLVTPILEKFYQATPGQGENVFNFSRSNFLKDKYICYIIVLHLFIHKFQFDIIPLAKHLKLDIKKLIMYCKECGCTVTKNNEKQIAKLKQFKQ